MKKLLLLFLPIQIYTYQLDQFEQIIDYVGYVFDVATDLTLDHDYRYFKIVSCQTHSSTTINFEASTIVEFEKGKLIQYSDSDIELTLICYHQHPGDPDVLDLLNYNAADYLRERGMLAEEF